MGGPDPTSAVNKSQELFRYRLFDYIMALFVTVLIVSNIASSAKIVDWGFSLFGVRMAFDAGTLLFPVSYIFGDILTEVYGYRRSRRVIWTGFFCLAFSVAGAVDRSAFCRARPPGSSTPGKRLTGHPGRDEQRRDRAGQPVGLLGRGVLQLVHPGEDEDPHPGTLAVDAHHRQHHRRRAGGYGRLRSWWLRSLGSFRGACS